MLIVGGGPAGLSAALILGRCRLSALICDNGDQRNLRSHHLHGLLGHDGTPPASFLDKGRSDVAKYSSISERSSRVESIERQAGGFAFLCADGTRGTAKRILLATGIADELPKIDGIDGVYGQAVHHCLYCDGFEYAGRPLAAFGIADKGAALALMMTHWSPHVALLTNGEPLGKSLRARLLQKGIELHEERIERMWQVDASLLRIAFINGKSVDWAALFFSTGCGQKSDLWRQLGCRRDKKGGLIADPLTGETTSFGVYAAGDASRDVLLIAVAVAEGAKAAVSITRAFLTEKGLI